MDEFFDVPGYPGYRANRLGQIKGKRGWIMKPSNNTSGYPQIAVQINGIQLSTAIHRLVALTFLPNPINLETVDHINNDKTDNRVENLRWMTKGDNVNRRDCIVDGKCYNQHKKGGFYVGYTIDGIRHRRYFSKEDDAEFYVSLLKAIYPRV
jgi:hypothetical protein